MQDRALATRSHLLLGAAKVFDRYGYAGARMSDIITTAGVTKGALYFHFDSKEALAQAVVSYDQDLADSVTATNQLAVQDVIDFTFAFCRALQTDVRLRASVRIAVEHGTFASADEGFSAYSVWREALSAHLTRARKAGELVSNTPPDEEAAGAIVASVTGLQIMSNVETGRKDLLERLEQWWRLTLPGLVGPDSIDSYTLG